MLSIESYELDVYKATPEEQEAWAKLMSEHYSNEKDYFSPEFFLSHVRKHGDRLLRIHEDMDKAFEEVFSGERGNRPNTGTTEDKCDDRIYDYFRRLSICDPYAIREQEERIERMSKMDFSWIDKELERMGVL